MAINLGQAITGAGRFYSGFQEGQSRQRDLETQRLQLEALRRQEETAARNAAAARQAAGARLGMITSEAPTFDQFQAPRMDTADVSPVAVASPATPMPQPEPIGEPMPPTGQESTIRAGVTPPIDTTGMQPGARRRAVREQRATRLDQVPEGIEYPELYAQAQEEFTRNRGAILSEDPDATVDDVYQGILAIRGLQAPRGAATGATISDAEMAAIDRQRGAQIPEGVEDPQTYADAQRMFEANPSDFRAQDPNVTVMDVYRSLLAYRQDQPTTQDREQAQTEVTQATQQLQETTRQQAGIREQDDLINQPVDEGLTEAYVEGIEGPQRTGVDTQRLLQERQNLVQLAQINARSGTSEGNAKFDEYYTRIREIDTRLQYLQGMQGITDFRMRNDPQRLAAVWSAYAGNQIQIQPRTDGQYNIYIEGQLTQEGLGQDQIIAAAKLAFSEEARDKLAEAQASRAEVALAIEQATSEAMGEARANAYEAYLTQEIDRAAERVSNSGVQETIEGPNGEQIVISMDEQGNIRANLLEPAQPGTEPGFFGGLFGAEGTPPLPTRFSPVAGLSGTSGPGFSTDLLENWNQ